MRGKVNTLLYCSQIMTYLMGMGDGCRQANNFKKRLQHQYSSHRLRILLKCLRF